MVDIFGFEIRRKRKLGTEDEVRKDLPSFAPKQVDDGALEVSNMGGITGGVFAQRFDAGVGTTSEKHLINKYRQIASAPEAELAIDDIVNEAVVIDDKKPPVVLNLDKVDLSSSIKKKILKEFDDILKLFSFGRKGSDIFRRWYIDGRIYYHMIVDDKAPQKGIQELRPIDPRNIRKVREDVKQMDEKTGVEKVVKTIEYFIYVPEGNLKGAAPVNPTSVIKVDPLIVAYVPSGLIDNTSNLTVSYLHKAIKAFNMLRMLEDSVVIYRLARAPERRLFYIDTGNLPKAKAEEYVKGLMNRFRNKIVYDSTTGEIANDRNHMHMLEDFWLPRREGGKGTEVGTLQSGQNLGQMEDVEYFQKKFYRALHVPVSRIQSDTGFNLGRASEITRDELKFSKFIHRMRNRFAELFNIALRYQLLLKKVITEEDWDDKLKEDLQYAFTSDSQFERLKNLEIVTEQLNVLGAADVFVGRFFSEDWIKRHIMFQDDEEIKAIEKQIEDENDDREDEGKPPLDQVTSIGGTYGLGQGELDAVNMQALPPPTPAGQTPPNKPAPPKNQVKPEKKNTEK